MDRRRPVRVPALRVRQARARRLDGRDLSRRAAPRTLKELAKPVGAVALGFAGLVLFEPDLGTALVIMLVVGAILLVSGTRMSLLVTAYGMVIALAGIAAWSSPYRRDRLLTFLDPWKDPTGAGLQNVQALISIGSGGIFGTGLGNGTATLRYLLRRRPT